MPYQPKVLIDFDGVIHKYSRGWADGTAYDEPMENAREYLELIQGLGYEVVIFSTRDAEAIVAWLYLWNFPILRVTNQKEPAVALIDDRAIRFNSWEQAAEDLLSLYPIALPEGVTITMPAETPIETPQPPSETSLGKDATSADDVAQVQEDALVAEEMATDE